MNKEVIIYGGSFNPPTLGHKHCIDQAIAKYPNAELWLTPSNNAIDKGAAIASKTRLALLETFVNGEYANEPRVKIIDSQLHKAGDAITYNMNLELMKALPNTKFIYPIGEDSIALINNWQSSKLLLTKINWLIVKRHGAKVNTLPKHYSYLAPTKEPISSTAARNAIKNGLPTTHLLPPTVRSFIDNNKIYQ